MGNSTVLQQRLQAGFFLLRRVMVFVERYAVLSCCSDCAGATLFVNSKDLMSFQALLPRYAPADYLLSDIP